MIGLVLGIAIGIACFYSFPDKKTAVSVADYMSLVSAVFLRLIKMIIGPLVLTTLIVGIGHMGDAATLGRVGAKTMAWFISASIVSLLLGLLMANLLQPGHGIVIADQAANTANLSSESFSFKNFVEHLVPTSLFKSLAEGEILQIVVFSMFAGVAIMALGERGKPLIQLADDIAHMMLVITGYVMKVAPFAVCAAVASVITKSGPGVLLNFAKFLGGFYLTLAILWALLLGVGYFVLGGRMTSLVSRMREPFLLAFSTASSEASYPKILDQLERFGVSKRIASFVLPLGYSFNLDGTMAYTTFATLFIAQAYGIELSIGTQLTIAAVLMLTSKGVAGVPRASLVVILATLQQFKIPEAGLFLIIGIDQFLDMGRSATNVIGNSLAASAVAKFEGDLGPEKDDIGVAGATPAGAHA
ncbi:dicarboxylate/amino acid:cation symporter [Labrys sp. KB_33_2]|uniref:dicarboxylate/amino acid:cation symporter n=1 Tax=unclassified Labrys (in: a-proteobacteria) TaxID=2688601 RepID=UPI003EB8C41B